MRILNAKVLFLITYYLTIILNAKILFINDNIKSKNTIYYYLTRISSKIYCIISYNPTRILNLKILFAISYYLTRILNSEALKLLTKESFRLMVSPLFFEVTCSAIIFNFEKIILNGKAIST